jgi:hypothetical protein
MIALMFVTYLVYGARMLFSTSVFVAISLILYLIILA